MQQIVFDEIRDLSPLQTREIVTIKSALWHAAGEIYFDDANKVASEVFYNARDHIFGGSFPFSIGDVSNEVGAFGGIWDDERFALACMSNFKPIVLKDRIWVERWIVGFGLRELGH